MESHHVAYKRLGKPGTPDVHYATLRLPAASEPCAVVVNIHGGFWKPQWNLHTLPTATLLAAFGDDVRQCVSSRRRVASSLAMSLPHRLQHSMSSMRG